MGEGDAGGEGQAPEEAPVPAAAAQAAANPSAALGGYQYFTQLEYGGRGEAADLPEQYRLVKKLLQATAPEGGQGGWRHPNHLRSEDLHKTSPEVLELLMRKEQGRHPIPFPGRRVRNCQCPAILGGMDTPGENRTAPLRVTIQGAVKEQTYNKKLQKTVREKLALALRRFLDLTEVEIDLEKQIREVVCRKTGAEGRQYGQRQTVQIALATGNVVLKVPGKAYRKVCDLVADGQYGGYHVVAKASGEGICKVEADLVLPLGEEAQEQKVYLVHPAFPALKEAELLSVLYRAVLEACFITAEANRYTEWLKKHLPIPESWEAVLKFEDLVAFLNLVKGERTEQGYYCGVLRDSQVFAQLRRLNKVLVVPTFDGALKLGAGTVPMRGVQSMAHLPMHIPAEEVDPEAMAEFLESECAVEIQFPKSKVEREKLPQGMAMLTAVAEQLIMAANSKVVVLQLDGEHQYLTPGERLVQDMGGCLERWGVALKRPVRAVVMFKKHPRGFMTDMPGNKGAVMACVEAKRTTDLVKFVMIEEMQLQYTTPNGEKYSLKARTGVRPTALTTLGGGGWGLGAEIDAEGRTEWAKRVMTALEWRAQKVKAAAEKEAAAQVAKDAEQPKGGAETTEAGNKRKEAKGEGQQKVKRNPLGDMAEWEWEGECPPPQLEQRVGEKGATLIKIWAKLSVVDRQRMAGMALKKRSAEGAKETMESVQPLRLEEAEGPTVGALMKVQGAVYTAEIGHVDECLVLNPLGPYVGVNWAQLDPPSEVLEGFEGEVTGSRLLTSWSILTPEERREEAAAGWSAALYAGEAAWKLRNQQQEGAEGEEERMEEVEPEEGNRRVAPKPHREASPNRGAAPNQGMDVA
jgi:hypothetical protein